LSETISGVIEYIGQKNGFWNIKLDDNEWYGAGKYEPKCNKGDTVEFDIEWRGDFKNIVNKTLNVLERAQRGGGSSRGGNTQQRDSGSRGNSSGGYREGRTSPREQEQPARRAGGSKDDYWARKEERDLETQPKIEFQAARNSAIEFVKLLGTLNLMELKGSKSDQMGIVELYVAKFTEQFYNDTAELKASTPNFDKSDKVRKAPETEAVKTTTSAKPRGRPPAEPEEPEYEEHDGINDDPAFDDDIPFGRD
jgi:hypothetical protein